MVRWGGGGGAFEGGGKSSRAFLCPLMCSRPAGLQMLFLSVATFSSVGVSVLFTLLFYQFNIF